MGVTLEDKKKTIAELQASLSEAQLVAVIDYKGLTVAEISDLRKRLRETGASCTVAKNTLMRKATEDDPTWAAISEHLKGTSAFLFLKDDLGGAIKAYKSFQKDTNKTTLRGGVMEGRALTEQEVDAVTELPTKEELMARLAGALKANQTKLARGVNAVPTKLARGLNEVPSKLVRAIKAVSEKDESGEGE